MGEQFSLNFESKREEELEQEYKAKIGQLPQGLTRAEIIRSINDPESELARVFMLNRDEDTKENERLYRRRS